MSLVRVGSEMEDEVCLAINEHVSGVDKPMPAKRIKLEEPDLDKSQSLKQIMFNINKAICIRLDSMENKLELIDQRTKDVEDKLDELIHLWNREHDCGSPLSQSGKSGAVIVGLPRRNRSGSNSGKPLLDGPMQNLGPNVTLITLNSEEDYPNGSWVGDENNPEMRVRVPITPSDLLHIHSNCRTAEKMALTLLDYLFNRETQAISNLSGTGKHGKRQLDPLMIYGMRCHLIHRFGVSEQDWHRIKLNIDSKCRTAFRRRIKGLPMTVKGFRGIMGQRNNLHGMDLGSQSDEDSMQHEGELQISGEHIDLTNADVANLTTAQLIHNAGGEIQVLQATPEQVAHLQQTHQIQILQGDHVLGCGDLSAAENIQMAVSLPKGDRTLQIIGGTPETIHISPQDAEELTETHD